MEQNTNNAKTIIGIGTTGLVGSRIAEVLKSYRIKNFSTENGIDIADPASIEVLTKEEGDTILLLAAKADVDGCELDKPLIEQGDAWKINVSGVENVAQLCLDSGKKLIYISTDFVFDGANPPETGYSEDDTCNPINWYGITKRKGEEAVLSAKVPYLILRIAYPYRSAFAKKSDFVHAMLNRLKAGRELFGVTDHVMTPTFVDDIASAIETLLDKNMQGIFHVVGSQYITPFDAAVMIAKMFHLDKSLIKPTTRDQFFQNRAQRPFNLSLKNDKIKQLGVSLRRFDEGLRSLSS